MAQHGIIRTIYLYIFTLLGLIFLTIGSVRFIDMGLKTFVFTQADEELRMNYKQPPMPYSLERVEEMKGSEALTVDQKAQVENWLTDYENWKGRSEKIDPVISERHRDASWSLAMILMGLPLYIYHWGVIKKETKKA